jgi:tryptophan synthase alpha chain
VSGVRDLETVLQMRRDAGRKALAAYVTAGCVPFWQEAVVALVEAGADVVELGIPFSDPMIDGPVIQEASRRAIEAGTTPEGVLAALGRVELAVPVLAMTYYNLVYRRGHERMAGELKAAGAAGALVVDLPLEELGSWRKAAREVGLATVLMVAPSTPPKRVRAICDAASGFVYAAALMGVTGERAQLARSAADVVARARAETSLPVLLGIGIATPEQASEAAALADGVVVGSGVVRRLIEGDGPEPAAAFVASLRAALDAGADVPPAAAGASRDARSGGG